MLPIETHWGFVRMPSAPCSGWDWIKDGYGCFRSLLSMILRYTGLLPRFTEAMGAGDASGDRSLLPGAYLQSVGGWALGSVLPLHRPTHQGLNASCLFREAPVGPLSYKQALRPKMSFSQDPLGKNVKHVCIHFRNIPILNCFGILKINFTRIFFSPWIFHSLMMMGIAEMWPSCCNPYGALYKSMSWLTVRSVPSWWVKTLETKPVKVVDKCL